MSWLDKDPEYRYEEDKVIVEGPEWDAYDREFEEMWTARQTAPTEPLPANLMSEEDQDKAAAREIMQDRLALVKMLRRNDDLAVKLLSKYKQTDPEGYRISISRQGKSLVPLDITPTTPKRERQDYPLPDPEETAGPFTGKGDAIESHTQKVLRELLESPETDAHRRQMLEYFENANPREYAAAVARFKSGGGGAPTPSTIKKARPQAKETYYLKLEGSVNDLKKGTVGPESESIGADGRHIGKLVPHPWLVHALVAGLFERSPTLRLMDEQDAHDYIDAQLQDNSPLIDAALTMACNDVKEMVRDSDVDLVILV